ncbi:MAG: PQQ-like beta-propeller repeat protein [Holophagales bacterium]|nr:PQQ-like beta-propeller repeat protein [Holophagales bacterium]
MEIETGVVSGPLGPRRRVFRIAALLLAVAGVTAACATEPPPVAPGEAASPGEVAARESAPDRLPDPPDLRSRTHGSDWPTFLGPTRDGKSPETGLPADRSGPRPLLWQVEVGEGYSAPSVALGRLFLFDRVDDRARLRCLRAESGQELWRSKYPTAYEDMYGYSGGPRTAPVVDGARVFPFGVQGRLRAQRVDTGELLWEADTAGRYGVRQNFFGVGSTPVVARGADGGRLIVQVGGSPPDSPGIRSGNAKPDGSGIVAFDLATGRELYRLADELASYASPVLATIDDREGGDSREWGFVFARGGLVGFDPVAGRERFHFPWRARLLESVNAATPVVVGNRVFLTECYGPGSVLLELEGDTPRVVWKDGRRRQSLASHWATPVHVDGVLYGSSGRAGGSSDLRAVELATGEVLWAQPGLRRATVLYVDGHLVVLGEYGELVLVKADPERHVRVADWTPKDAQGDPLLRFPAWNAPILAQGILYVRGKDRLLALELIPPAE